MRIRIGYAGQHTKQPNIGPNEGKEFMGMSRDFGDVVSFCVLSAVKSCRQRRAVVVVMACVGMGPFSVRFQSSSSSSSLSSCASAWVLGTTPNWDDRRAIPGDTFGRLQRTAARVAVVVGMVLGGGYSTNITSLSSSSKSALAWCALTSARPALSSSPFLYSP